MLQIHICKRQRNLIFWAILTSNEKAIDTNVSKEKKKQERRAKKKNTVPPFSLSVISDNLNMLNIYGQNIP